jgi:hypothetical protein
MHIYDSHFIDITAAIIIHHYNYYYHYYNCNGIIHFKGVNLSESDDGFVFVDSTPLISPLHPWRNSANTSTPNMKNKKNEKINSVKISDNYNNENEKMHKQKNDDLQYDNNSQSLNLQNYALQNQQHTDYKLNISPSLLYENEKNEKIIISAMTQRCDYVCEVVLAIVSIGDMIVKDALLHEKRSVTPILGFGVGSGSKGGGGKGNIS